MSYSVGSDEGVDIYKDLPAYVNYEEEIKNLNERIKNLEDKLQTSEKEKHSLMGKYLQVRKNISSLYKTALTEVNRKKRTIDDLRTQLEDSVFRRNKKHRAGFPDYQYNKANRYSNANWKQSNSPGHVNKSNEEEKVPVTSLKLCDDDEDKASVITVQEIPIIISAGTSGNSFIPATQSSDSKRVMQHPKTPPNTIYTRRFLNRTKAGERKVGHVKVENNVDPLHISSCVVSDKASVSKHIADMSKSAKEEDKCATEETKPIFEPRDASEVIRETGASWKSNVETDDSDCVIVHVKKEKSCIKQEVSSELQVQTTQKIESRRFLNRTKADKRKVNHLKNENNVHPSHTNSCVVNDSASLSKQVADVSKSVKVEDNCMSMETKPIFKPRDGSEFICGTSKSQKSILEMDDSDCMLVDVKQGKSSIKEEVSPKLYTGTTQKVEPQVKAENDNSEILKNVSLVPDFRHRRRAKVLSVSTGNKIIFSSPLSSSSGRNNEGVNVSTATENHILETVKCENISRVSDSNTTTWKRGVIHQKDNHTENKFSESYKMSGVHSGENIICQSSDDSKNDYDCKNFSEVQQSNSEVKLLRRDCADVDIDQTGRKSPAMSVSCEKMNNEKISEGTSPESFTIHKQSSVKAEYCEMKYRPTSTESEAATEKKHNSPDTSETKCITLGRRKRKPVSLGDSSSVLTDTPKS